MSSWIRNLFKGEGISQTGSGTIHVGRDINIGTRSKENDFLRRLKITITSDDKARIERTKGGLLNTCYDWILHHDTFRQWRDADDGQLLWIRGDPGKGKTMLVCGIINHLESRSDGRTVVYFFCQATDDRINSANAVVRGIVYALLKKHEFLTEEVLNKYGDSGDEVFQDANSWDALCEMLQLLLKKIGSRTCILIDGLDECRIGLEELLELVVRISELGVRLLVSSRNWPSIESGLRGSTEHISVRLELNHDSISAAVDTYIRHQVTELAHKKKLDKSTQVWIDRYLRQNANDTFLWVALVCQQLGHLGVRGRHIEKLVQSFPPGLDAFYERMEQEIRESEDVSLCQQVLGLMAILYRPIHLQELLSLVEDPNAFGTSPDDTDCLCEIIELCGSFLTVRDSSIYFVHQTSKEFVNHRFSGPLLTHDISTMHQVTAIKAIKAMSEVLEEDMYRLLKPGIHIDHVVTPEDHPLQRVKYACVHWADHVVEAACPSMLIDDGPIHNFLIQSLIHWLESLSHLRTARTCIISITKLLRALDGGQKQSNLARLLSDALRFTRYFIECIEDYPIQIYSSATIFTPKNSRIRDLIRTKQPNWIAELPGMRNDWDECLQTITSGAFGKMKGHCMALSPNNDNVACGMEDGSIGIWDTLTGHRLRTLQGHASQVDLIAFSPQGDLLATGSADRTVRIWNTSTGDSKVLGHLEEGLDTMLIFVSDPLELRVVSLKDEIHAWALPQGQVFTELREAKQTTQRIGDNKELKSVVLSPNGRLVAFTKRMEDGSQTIIVWDLLANLLQHSLTLQAEDYPPSSLKFSPDGTRLAINDECVNVLIWHLGNEEALSVDTSAYEASSLAFSEDAKRVVIGQFCGDLEIFDTQTGLRERTLRGHRYAVKDVCFFKNEERLISSDGYNIRIWDITMDPTPLTNAKQSITEFLALSPDQDIVAVVVNEEERCVKNTATGELVSTMQIEQSIYHFSWTGAFCNADSQMRLVTGDKSGQIQVWEAATGQLQYTFDNPSRGPVSSIKTSPDGSLIAAICGHGVQVWDSHGRLYQKTECNKGHCRVNVAFAPDSKTFAFLHDHHKIQIMDTETGQPLKTLNVPPIKGYATSDLIFSPNGIQIAQILRETARGSGAAVQIWNVATGHRQPPLKEHLPLTLPWMRDASTASLCDTGFLRLAFSGSLHLQVDTLPETPTGIYSQGGLYMDDSGGWILLDKEPILWVPSGWRKDFWLGKGNMILLYSTSDQLISIKLSEEYILGGHR